MKNLNTVRKRILESTIDDSEDGSGESLSSKRLRRDRKLFSPDMYNSFKAKEKCSAKKKLVRVKLVGDVSFQQLNLYTGYVNIVAKPCRLVLTVGPCRTPFFGYILLVKTRGIFCPGSLCPRRLG